MSEYSHDQGSSLGTPRHDSGGYDAESSSTAFRDDSGDHDSDSGSVTLDYEEAPTTLGTKEIIPKFPERPRGGFTHTEGRRCMYETIRWACYRGDPLDSSYGRLLEPNLDGLHQGFCVVGQKYECTRFRKNQQGPFACCQPQYCGQSNARPDSCYGWDCPGFWAVSHPSPDLNHRFQVCPEFYFGDNERKLRKARQIQEQNNRPKEAKEMEEKYGRAVTCNWKNMDEGYTSFEAESAETWMAWDGSNRYKYGIQSHYPS
ncbi:hypothetical protein NHQ30_005405 [Ciborinia camelliae]|nr:hypothetical protein NHQ30_005405 [Ciborinia camelliae]